MARGGQILEPSHVNLCVCVAMAAERQQAKLQALEDVDRAIALSYKIPWDT